MSRAWPRGMLAAGLFVALLLGGCTTTTTTTSSDNREPRPVPNAAPADPERRAQARLELASLYFSRGQHETALDEIRQALSARPDLPEAIGLRALVLSAVGDLAGAEQSFQRAMQLAPTDADLVHNHGWFLCQQRRFAEAETQFDRALAMPGYRDAARTLMAKGACQARNGRWADAERTLSRSYELDPGSPVTAFNLSEVLLRRGELERARFYAGRINAVPEQVNAQSLWLAARIERRLGNQQALLDLGRQLRERFPQAPETLQFERGRFDD
jgi:type IV pilus assembly protein PilF